MIGAQQGTAAQIQFSSRRPSVPTSGKLISIGLPKKKRRITINVGGERFQTYENTLARYPDSLLGSPERRQAYYDARKNEYTFPSQNKNVFNAILFFYQAEILSRPDDIPLQAYIEELKFFDLAKYSNEIPLLTLMHRENEVPNNTLRQKIWNFLENPKTQVANALATFNVLLVFIWLLILCLETKEVRSKNAYSNFDFRENTTTNFIDTKSNVSQAAGNSKDFNGWASDTWFVLDTIFVVWFTADYLLHIICEPCLRAYVLSPLGAIDVLTIAPYYITLVTRTIGTTVISQCGLLRFLRVFRLFKATRYSSALRIMLGSLTSSAKDFPIWFILMVMHIVFFSSILYYVEGEFGNPQFSNIPDVMYFTVITMCAVGYGDVVPQSTLGKIVTSFAALSGIVIVYCVPAPTLKTNFNRLNELYRSQKKDNRTHLNGKSVRPKSIARNSMPTSYFSVTSLHEKFALKSFP